MVFDAEKGRSALEVLSLERFKSRTTVIEEVISVPTSRLTILKNNPNRLHIALLNEGDIDIRVSSDANISTTSGWLLLARGGVITFSWEEDGEAVGYEYYAVAAASGGLIRVREVIVL